MTLQEHETHIPYWFHDLRGQLKQHVYTRSEAAFSAGDATRDTIHTAEQLQERQRAVRASLLKALGGLPPSDTPLHPEITGIVEGDGFRIEKVIFQSRPSHYVTCNLYVPDDIDEPRGAVLFLCGHHEKAKHANEYQRVCQYLVQAGLIVLSQDPIGQGERFSYLEPKLGTTTVRWGTREHEYAGLQCLPTGEGIARYFLHDAMRGVDYLCSRPEVDPTRIGVTGNSGGGTQTVLMMMADPRLAAAVPATFLMSRQSYMWTGGAQDAEQIWPGMTADGFDHEDFLLAMAPRPVRVLAVTSDFFPIEGTRRTVERCERFWDLAGAEGCLDFVEDESTHRFTNPLARAAAEFFARHLLGTEVQPDDSRIKILAAETLGCTPTGQVRSSFPDAAFVVEENQARVGQVAAAREAQDKQTRLARAKAWLHHRVMSHREPVPLNPRRYHTSQVGELTVTRQFWYSQPQLVNSGFLFRDFRLAGETLPVTLALWDGGTTTLQPHLAWIRRTCAQGRAILALNVTGAGGIAAEPFGKGVPEAFYEIIHKMCDDLFWLNDDLASLRTFDVLRAIELISESNGLDAGDIRIYAHGKHGTYGRFAAALDKRICGVEVVNGVPPYSDWVSDRYYDSFDMKSLVIPGMLQFFDLPDLPEMAACSLETLAE